MHSKSNPTFDMVKGIQAFSIFQIECITYRLLYHVTIFFCMFDNHFSSSFIVFLLYIIEEVWKHVK